MAQVARDRHEHLALALGQDEVVPAEGRLEPGGELTDARARGLPRAEVEVRGRRTLARPARQPPAARPRQPSAIWPTERRNFAATSPTSSVPARAAQSLAPLGKRRQRHLHDEHGGVSQRNGGLPRGRADDAARSLRAASARLRPGRARPGRAGRARRSRARRRRARPRARRRAGASGSDHPGDVQRATSGRSRATASRAAASGPATTTGRRLSIASRARSSATVAGRPGS